MKTILYLSLFFLLSLPIQAQQMTVVPDSEFEQFLVDEGIDSDGLVNGQVPTNDAENVTKIIIEDYAIEDMTGLEDFVNIDTLVIHDTDIEELPLDSLSKLKYLNCTHNKLTEINVSGNPLLEEFYVTHWVDYWPDRNTISAIDLSNNPNIKKLIYKIAGASNYEINLNNGNNNPDMYIDISMDIMSPPAPDNKPHTCIKVDDAEAARNNTYPYSEWELYHTFMNYDFTDDLEECLLGVPEFDKSALKLYPNPAQEAVHIAELNTALRFDVYNLSGQQVLHKKLSPANNRVDLTPLSTGVYLYKMREGKQVVKTGKLVKE